MNSRLEIKISGKAIYSQNIYEMYVPIKSFNGSQLEKIDIFWSEWAQFGDENSIMPHERQAWVLQACWFIF